MKTIIIDGTEYNLVPKNDSDRVKKIREIYETLKELCPDGSMSLMIHSFDLSEIGNDWILSDELTSSDGSKYKSASLDGLTLFVDIKEANA